MKKSDPINTNNLLLVKKWKFLRIRTMYRAMNLKCGEKDSPTPNQNTGADTIWNMGASCPQEYLCLHILSLAFINFIIIIYVLRFSSVNCSYQKARKTPGNYDACARTASLKVQYMLSPSIYVSKVPTTQMVSPSWG